MSIIKEGGKIEYPQPFKQVTAYTDETPVIASNSTTMSDNNEQKVKSAETLNTKIQAVRFETNGLRVLVVPSFDDMLAARIYKENLVLNVTPDCSIYKNKERWIKIPEGNWKYHCTTDTMTEEQAKVLIESETENIHGFSSEIYSDYENDDDYFNNTIDSFKSLLRSHGINPNEKHVILIEQL